MIPQSPAAAFLTPYWYQAWADAFHPKGVSILTAREDAKLTGVLPLARVRTDSRGLYFSLIVPFALGDYQPFIVSPDSVRSVLPALLEAALDHYGRRGVYWWPHIPKNDPSFEVLKAFLASHRMPYVEEREVAPRLRLDGADYATLEQRWTSKHRGDVRRRRKRLAEEGPVALWMPSTLAEAEATLEEFFQVHDAKWLSQGLPGRFRDPVQRAHFQAILRRFWGHGIHFSTLRCGNINISFRFGLFSAGWLLFYRPSYRTEFSNFSPNKIHVSMLIEHGCQAGWQGFDFLLGEEPYKYLWTNEESEVVSIHSGFHSWSPSYFWFSKGKPLVRQKFQRAYMRAQAWRQKRNGPGE